MNPSPDPTFISLARYTIRASALTLSAFAGAWALQPVLARPAVGDAVLFFATAGGGVWLVAYSWHRWSAWYEERRAMRPPDLELAGQTFAHSITVPSLVGHKPPKQLDPEILWRWKVLHWCRWGTVATFAWSDMWRVCDRRTWDFLKNQLVAEGVLTLGRGTKPTSWAAGWHLGRLRAALYRQDIALPCPNFNYIIR